MTSIPPPPMHPPTGPGPAAWEAPAAGSGPLVDASWGARLGAYIIDGIVANLFYIPAIVVLFVGPKEQSFCEVDRSGSIVIGGNNANAICEGPTGATFGLAALLGIVAFVGYLIWRCRMEGTTGQSVGKKALDIRTVDADTGQPIGTGRAVGRYFAYIVSACVCGLGFLWPLWDKNKQAWHDKIVRSRVVKG